MMRVRKSQRGRSGRPLRAGARRNEACGDEVICSPYTFSATYNAILINKALPVFADTDSATLTMDPASIESRITGRSVGSHKGNGLFTRGTNYRMQHFQASILLAQFEKLVQETAVRRANADYLSAGLAGIPGIAPLRLPENSRPVWHHYAWRYDARQFNGLPRAAFMRALSAEGIPCTGGYTEQYNEGILDGAINSTGFKRLWSTARLKAYRESFKELKGNRQVCESTVGFVQAMLLADRGSMDHIIAAVRKIHAHSAALGNAA